MTQWKEIRLGDHLSFITSGSRGWSEYYASDGALFLRIQNVGYNELRLEDIAFVQPPDGAEARRTRVQPGDVLLSITADLGRTAVVPEGLGTAHINQHLAILRVKDIDPHYLAAFLSLGPGRLQLKRLDRIGVKSGLNFDDVRSLRILLPPLPEQRRIAAILDKADAIRRKRIEALRLANDFLKSAFLDMFGDPVMNSKNWPVCKLEEISEIDSGITKGRNLHGKLTLNIPYMRVANVQDGYLNLDDVKEIEVLPVEIEKYRLRPGDILLTEGGDPDKLGRGAVWQGLIDPCVHQNHIFCVRPNSSFALPDYLSFLIGSDLGKRYFLRSAKQTTGIATINKTQLRNFPVLLPPVNDQFEFHRLVKKFDACNARIKDWANINDRLFNSLVQRAFRGEL